MVATPCKAIQRAYLSSKVLDLLRAASLLLSMRQSLQYGQVGAGIAFDGRASSGGSGVIVTYAWDFGDGGTGSGATTSHIYAAPGTYQVGLTVINDRGVRASCSVVAVINCPAGAISRNLLAPSRVAEPLKRRSYDKMQNALATGTAPPLTDAIAAFLASSCVPLSIDDIDITFVSSIADQQALDAALDS